MSMIELPACLAEEVSLFLNFSLFILFKTKGLGEALRLTPT